MFFFFNTHNVMAPECKSDKWLGLFVQSKDRYVFSKVMTCHNVLHTCLFKVSHNLVGLHIGVMHEVVA
jgi:hypothetical protein